MRLIDPQSPALEAAVHLIQSALTPVFLLSGIAALLNVFAGRLAKVSDRLDHLAGLPPTTDAAAAARVDVELAALHRRSAVLDAAVVLGSLGAVATCMAIMTLFLLAISTIPVASVLLLFFGTAIVCTLGSVAAFGLEMLISSHALRGRMHAHMLSLARLSFFRRFCR